MKCLYLNLNYECDKDFCENCPVFYDWAVYEIYKKEEKEKEERKRKGTKIEIKSPRKKGSFG